MRIQPSIDDSLFEIIIYPCCYPCTKSIWRYKQRYRSLRLKYRKVDKEADDTQQPNHVIYPEKKSFTTEYREKENNTTRI